MSNSYLAYYFDLAMNRPTSLNYVADGRIKSSGLIQRDG